MCYSRRKISLWLTNGIYKSNYLVKRAFYNPKILASSDTNDVIYVSIHFAWPMTSDKV